MHPPFGGGPLLGGSVIGGSTVIERAEEGEPGDEAKVMSYCIVCFLLQRRCNEKFTSTSKV